MVVTEELRQELNQAAVATGQAYSTCPPLSSGTSHSTLEYIRLVPVGN